MVEIKSNNTVVTISEFGAEIQSVKVDGEERIWSGDPKFWDGRSPLLFPICGGLIDDKYTLNGKEYTLAKHGFARESVFTVEKQDLSSVTFLLCANEHTLKMYPYNFQLRVTYTITDNKLDVTYDVTNTDGEVMYYSIGSHEAYSCPEGYEQYDLVFPEKETLVALDVIGNQLGHYGVTVLKDGNVLPLYDRYFNIDALVFEKFNSKCVTLRNRTTGKEVTVEFPYATFLLIWTKPKAPFVCIEPWCGAPDFIDENGDISKKTGIMSIAPFSTSTTIHSVYFK